MGAEGRAGGQPGPRGGCPADRVTAAEPLPRAPPGAPSPRRRKGGRPATFYLQSRVRHAPPAAAASSRGHSGRGGTGAGGCGGGNRKRGSLRCSRGRPGAAPTAEGSLRRDNKAGARSPRGRAGIEGGKSGRTGRPPAGRGAEGRAGDSAPPPRARGVPAAREPTAPSIHCRRGTKSGCVLEYLFGIVPRRTKGVSLCGGSPFS